ncbi:hypothetical protein JXL19_04775 [bacterium]|nr:hypothetical protein [bacterium]
MDAASILLLFWHGLGDVIMATPAFREFVKQHPKCRLGIAVKKLVIESGILARCPYFDSIHEISSAWENKNYRHGIKKCIGQGINIQKNHGYERLIVLKQRPAWRYGIHKIYRTANELGVKPFTNTQTEVYISDQEWYEAECWLKEHGYQENGYIFLHRKTGFPLKDMPVRVAQNVIDQLMPLPVIEVNETYSTKNRPINFSFALMEKARYIVVVDSVFMHAADALGKDITMAYFAIRPGIVDEVRPLNVKCRCVESYTCSYRFLQRIYWLCQKYIYLKVFDAR